jgi:hypothetical protein
LEVERGQVEIYPVQFVEEMPEHLHPRQPYLDPWLWLKEVLGQMKDEDIARITCPSEEMAIHARAALKTANLKKWLSPLRAIATRIDGCYLYILKYDMVD